jgi:hypothetical protein
MPVTGLFRIVWKYRERGTKVQVDGVKGRHVIFTLTKRLPQPKSPSLRGPELSHRAHYKPQLKNHSTMFHQRSMFRAASQLRSPAIRSAFQRRFASTGSGGLHGAEDNAFNRERLAVKEHAAATSGEFKAMRICGRD